MQSQNQMHAQTLLASQILNREIQIVSNEDKNRKNKEHKLIPQDLSEDIDNVAHHIDEPVVRVHVSDKKNLYFKLSNPKSIVAPRKGVKNSKRNHTLHRLDEVFNRDRTYRRKDLRFYYLGVVLKKENENKNDYLVDDDVVIYNFVTQNANTGNGKTIFSFILNSKKKLDTENNETLGDRLSEVVNNGEDLNNVIIEVIQGRAINFLRTKIKKQFPTLFETSKKSKLSNVDDNEMESNSADISEISVKHSKKEIKPIQELKKKRKIQKSLQDELDNLGPLETVSHDIQNNVQQEEPIVPKKSPRFTVFAVTHQENKNVITFIDSVNNTNNIENGRAITELREDFKVSIHNRNTLFYNTNGPKVVALEKEETIQKLTPPKYR